MSHNKKQQWSAKHIRYEERLKRVEAMLLRGVTNHQEIAAAFGVSRQAVTAWVNTVRQRWQDNENAQSLDTKRNLRLGQLNEIFKSAMNAFDRSRKDQEEISIENRSCQNCGGQGKVEEQPEKWKICPHCNGAGKIVTERVKVSVKSGDPTFLSVAKEVVKEMAKLDGLDTTVKIGSRVLQQVATTASPVGDPVLQQQVQEFYLEAPIDTIIKAKMLIEEIENSKKRPPSSLVIEQGPSSGE